MRPLTEDESKAVFTKLANYIVSMPVVLAAPVTYGAYPGKESGSPH